ncbi:MAG: hypothetical protein QMB11_04465, partial [Nonlabens sp.]|uniref:beta strand repeat-containing protein n=1 Tax=Nonlabens sp. TaxID=1888209 RepID=UPI0035A73CE2
GTNADVGTNNLTNATALGYGATVAASNTIQLGNTAITNVNTSSFYTGSGFKTPLGNSLQFLKADGSVDSSTYLTSAGTATNVSGVVAIANGGTGLSAVGTNGQVLTTNSSGALAWASPSTTPDASITTKGIIKLAGDLTGTADVPIISSNAITSDKIVDGTIVDADVNANAAIADTKLATIATAGKVSNSATTATSLSTGYSIVSRDVYGSFAAGNITAAGLSTSDNINVKGITIGSRGGSSNIGIGDAAFNWSSPIGDSNTVLGIYAFTSSSGSNNTAIGSNSIRQGAGGSGDNNTAVGAASLSNGQAANNNTAIGFGTLTQSTGTDNTAIGYNAGLVITTGTQNTFLGSTAAAQNGSESINNATAIGYGATVDASDKIQLGNTSVTLVNTSGAIKAGAITYPNTDGTANQVLATDGSGTLAWATPSTTATAYSGILPTANGGTGSATQNFVDLTSNQTVAGIKTFNSDVNINGLTIGRGNFNENSNTAIGLGALSNNAGYANTAIGRGALASNNTNGGNTALGYIALSNNISGADNVAVGTQSLETNISGSENTAIGKHADVASDGISNATAIGANATVNASNKIQLGDGSVTAVQLGTGTNVTLETGLVKITGGAPGANKVLTSDANGLASWASPSSGTPAEYAYGYLSSSSAVATQKIVSLSSSGITISNNRVHLNANKVYLINVTMMVYNMNENNTYAYQLFNVTMNYALPNAMLYWGNPNGLTKIANYTTQPMLQVIKTTRDTDIELGCIGTAPYPNGIQGVISITEIK